MDSGCTYTEINKKLVKDKRIQIKLVDFYFEIFNIDCTKNREVIRMALLEIEINRHKEQIGAAVTDLNRINMFLEHGWLVKYNPEVNWKESKI